MVYLKKEQLGSDKNSQRWDFYDFPVTRKSSNVSMFVPNVATLFIRTQKMSQRPDVATW